MDFISHPHSVCHKIFADFLARFLDQNHHTSCLGGMIRPRVFSLKGPCTYTEKRLLCEGIRHFSSEEKMRGHKRRKSKERKKKRKKKERRKKKEKKQKGDGHARKIGGRNEDKRNLRHCEGRPNKRNEGITIKSAATECRRCQKRRASEARVCFLPSSSTGPFLFDKSCNGVPKHENRRRRKRRGKRRGEKLWGSHVCAIAPVIRLAVHLHARILVIASIYKSTSTPGGHFIV